MTSTIQIDGNAFDCALEHFRFPLWHSIADTNELEKLQQLRLLRSANFYGTQLDDRGLFHVAKVSTIEQLDLQNTNISNDGLAYIAQLPRLTHLRLKENRQLTNDCVPHILRVRSLLDLQIHETSIGQSGLDRLDALPHLRQLVVDIHDDKFSFNGLLQLSARMPECTILAKGCGEFRASNFEGTWPNGAVIG